MVGVKVRGSPVFQIVKPVLPNTQLLVYFDEGANGTVPIKVEDEMAEKSEAVEEVEKGKNQWSV